MATGDERVSGAPREFVQGAWPTGRVVGPDWVVLHVDAVRRLLSATQGLSLRQVSARVGMTPSGIGKIFNGQAWGDMRTFCKLSAEFLPDLFSGSPDPEPAMAFVGRDVDVEPLRWGDSVVTIVVVAIGPDVLLTPTLGDGPAAAMLDRARKIVVLTRDTHVREFGAVEVKSAPSSPRVARSRSSAPS
jgi:hypothetical protein